MSWNEEQGYGETVLRKWATELHRLELRVIELEAALSEACDEYDDAANYKGEYMRAKHRDDETLARLRALLVKGADK